MKARLSPLSSRATGVPGSFAAGVASRGICSSTDLPWKCFPPKLTQNRHPERSATQTCRLTQRVWRGVEGPRRCYLPNATRTVFTKEVSPCDVVLGRTFPAPFRFFSYVVGAPALMRGKEGSSTLIEAL